MQTQSVSLDLIDIYGGTQTRVTTNEEAIESYAEEMTRGVVFPPINLYYDGATYWLADGFHRYLAAKRVAAPSIQAEVQPGGRLDALKHALGANATNGVYRTNADKRNAATIALEEWTDRANPVIAEICRVSVELVRGCRQELTNSGRIKRTETVIGRDGKEYPAQMEHEPRGKSEESSAEKSEGGGGGGGGRPSGKGDGGAPGGSNAELEREARAMMRRGEMNPFELKTLMTANAHDYAATVINLLGTMKVDDPKRQEGLVRIKRWVERALAGEVMSPLPEGTESQG
jgi:ParB-like nuclease domain